MGCKKQAVKFAKGIAKQITPAITRAAGEAVLELERLAVEDPTFFTSSNKRRIALARIKSQARLDRIDLEETAARVLVEHAVAGLKKGAAELDDFGADDTAEEIVEKV